MKRAEQAEWASHVGRGGGLGVGFSGRLSGGVAVAAAVVMAAAGSAGAQVTAYTVREFRAPGAGGFVDGFAINDSGHAAGRGTTADPEGFNPLLFLPAPALGLPAGVTALPTLGGPRGAGYAINGAGVVVGFANPTPANPEAPWDVPERAFRWVPGSPGLQDLGTLGPGGRRAIAYDINDAGVIVGQAETGAPLPPPSQTFQYQRAFKWTPSPAGSGGAMVALPDFGGQQARALGINDLGHVVGFAWTNVPEPEEFGLPWDVEVKPVLWLDAPAYGFPAGMTDLDPTPPGTPIDVSPYGNAHDINNAGAVVGYRASRQSNEEPFVSRATIWLPAPLYGYAAGRTELPSALGPQGVSNAEAINEAGVVVGFTEILPPNPEFPIDQYVAAKWEGGQVFVLNDLIPAGSGWSLERAMDINEQGQIIGFGRVRDPVTNEVRFSGFVLDPVTDTPRPCNVADLVSIGGFPPADGELTVDDYTSFINAFAGDDLLADIVAIGGFPPSDGELTVDDYTSFINAFAEGC